MAHRSTSSGDAAELFSNLITPIINMYRLIITTILALAALTANAQKTVIEGSVLDAQGKTVDAYVTIAPKGTGSILGFADTDERGYYRLEFTTSADSVTVTAAGIGIGNVTRIVANRSQTLNIRTEEKVMQIKEVVVKATKIEQHGDTVSYLVGAYQQQGDRVIGDVLRRMPGIEVKDNGSIFYNGQAIKHFYVEEMDLLQGRYGIATNNINASDVARVQVMERHQAKKVLQGKDFTEDVAVNLKLKDSAKGTWAVNAMLGGGGQQAQTIGDNPLWTAEVVGMYFAKRRQNMTLYKGNNAGGDVSKELTAHYSGINSVGLYPFCPMSAVMPSGSGLPQKRTFDNRSHVVSFNHLEKLNTDNDITFNVGYYNDRINREGYSKTDLFLAESHRLVTEETLTSETHLHNLNGQLRYCRNSPNGFFADVVKVDASWNTDDCEGLLASNATSGNSYVGQHFRRPQLSLSNTLNTTHPIGKNLLDLHFSAGYSQRPNTLSVINDMDRSSQDIDSRHIAAKFSTKYDILLGEHFHMNYGLGASANLHGIKTALDGYEVPGYSSFNDLWYNTYTVVLGQSYKYDTRDYSITLGLPIELYSQTLDDHIRNDRHSYTHLLLSPSLSVNYVLGRYWSAHAGAYYSKTVGDPGGIYSGYIMNNYRSFQRSYVEQLSETKKINAEANAHYRNVPLALFGNVEIGYNRTHENQIYDYDYQGATSIVTAVSQPTVANSYHINGELTKGFDFLRSGIHTFGGYRFSDGEELVGGKLYQYKSRGVSFGGALSFSPLSWMGVIYSCGFSYSKSYTNGNDSGSRNVRGSTQRLSMNVYPTKKLTLTIAAEDNYNNLTAENRHAWFGDVTAKLKLKRIDLDLQLNNLFDQRQYTRVNYSGLDIYTQTSQLRPRNVIGTIRFKLL